MVNGQGEYGRGRDDHGNDDYHEYDHRDDQDDATLVRLYGGYSDGAYGRGLGYDYGSGRGGCDGDCRAKEKWRFSANGVGCIGPNVTLKLRGVLLQDVGRCPYFKVMPFSESRIHRS